MEDVTRIVADIKSGAIKPLYFLQGDEPYYIDKIAAYIEDNVLKEEERGFNQMLLYGRDVSIDEIISNAKRYPMMAERQVIIVKEAQDLSRSIENLVSYVENPQPTTVLVFCYKYKTLDKRKKLAKALSKKGELFESKKLYDNQVGDWIRRVLSGRNYDIQPKGAQMLVEFLGNDLSKISNELDKLTVVIPKGKEITPQLIEENIGISKDFNNFELQKAIGEKQVVKANQIITYFAHNQKSHPLIMSIAILNSFFTKLLSFHGLKDKTKMSAAKSLKVNPYFVQDYITASRHYPMRKVSQIIGFLREADVKSKGVGANSLSDGDILKELVFRILH
ncbi:DNA polymerase III subunit delta [Urechidicola vernalis]|uniref:DNA polymerase III subunit delta n=1 Tax=Urechidicola vernalis TaxID=3075600 RepID=A0ABU2Y6Q9_9FLAO|nr:DNA polymerase III subunit delta [Urechidicola sp. P050]MDT0553881.1 DNA polymerase III subunit delta [Urechidicola sp. P050]